MITYRELRLLELDIIKELQKGQQVIDLQSLIYCNVDKFYGIEYEEFPAKIAQVALWLMDHQMNMLAGQEFGEYFVRLPLNKSAKILHGNALRADWEILIKTPVPEVDPKNERFNYIFGNPPFVGKQMQSPLQKLDMELVFNGVKGAGVLDYVAAWYIKTAQYLQKYCKGPAEPVRAAFVSTNSIAQGEQVGILWNELFNHYKIKIHFAHRTFKWGNEARGNAAVHVVIIGFSNYDVADKFIYEYDDIKGEPHESKVKNINPYLVEGKDFVILSRTKPMNNVPEMIYGSKPVDDGNLLLDDEDKIEYLKNEPEGFKFIKPILSSHEFIHGKNRYCFWLQNANPTELKGLTFLTERIRKVKEFREKSTKASVREHAHLPYLFSEIRQPNNNYILIPRHSSESRRFIPFGFFNADVIVSDSCIALPNALQYHFGIISSTIHMVWVKYICGRIKSDFRYSNVLVYNNFPWPENPSEKQKELVEKAAQNVLDARALFPGSSLADLYDPLTMPPALVRAHQELDKAVDLCYCPQPFTSETKRIEYLFELYDKYTAGMFGANRSSSTRK